MAFSASLARLTVFLALGFYITSAQDSAASKIYGVNLGGWLVLEQFITPTFWDLPNNRSLNHTVIDEWTWSQYAKQDPTGRITDALRNHWDTWVTEEDVSNLSRAGLTHLRIPVGYWIVMNQTELDSYQEPYLIGGWSYFVRAVKWAKMYNMKVVVDLHSAPGHQNPWQHSGRAYHANWGKGDSINRTLDILERLSIRIKNFENDSTLSGVVDGIGILNEPYPDSIAGGLWTVKSFYKKAYPVIRRHLPADKYKYIIDAAFSMDAWNNFMSESNYSNVVLDLHRYQCFDPYLQIAPWSLHWNISCRIDAYPSHPQTLPSIVGEWSVGYKVAAEWAWAEPFPSTAEQIWLKRYGLAQMFAYERTSMGWFFWNFKTETAPMWNYLLGVEHGWLPCSLPVQQDVDTACDSFSNQVCLYQCNNSSYPACSA